MFKLKVYETSWYALIEINSIALTETQSLGSRVAQWCSTEVVTWLSGVRFSVRSMILIKFMSHHHPSLAYH